MKCSIQVAPLPHRLTWSAIVAEWAPLRQPCFHGNKELTFLCGCPQGAWELGSQRGLGPLCSLGT